MARFNLEDAASEVYEKAESMYKGSEINADILENVTDKYFADKYTEKQRQTLIEYFKEQEELWYKMYGEDTPEIVESKKLNEDTTNTLDGEDVTNQFQLAKAFMNNFEPIKVIKNSYDKNYYIYKASETDSKNYLDFSKSMDYVAGWLNGAIKANNGVITKKQESKIVERNDIERIPTSELPEFCYSYNETTGEIIIIKKGVLGYFPSKVNLEDLPEGTDKKQWAEEYIKEQNELLEVTDEQRLQMELNSMFGWDDEKTENKKVESINSDGFPNDEELQKYFQKLDKLPDTIELEGITYNIEQYGGSGDNSYVIYTDANNNDSYIKVFYTMNKVSDNHYQGVKKITGVSDLRESKKITEARYEVYTQDDYDINALGETQDFTIIDNTTGDFYYDENGDSPVFYSEEEAQAYCDKLNNNEKVSDNNLDEEVLLYTKRLNVARDLYNKNHKDDWSTLTSEEQANFFNRNYKKINTLAQATINESVNNKKITENTKETTSFQEISDMMEIAEDYSELYAAADLIEDSSIKQQVLDILGECEDDNDDVSVAYSLVTTDIIDELIMNNTPNV